MAGAPPKNKPWQVTLLRLSASMACFAVALGLLQIANQLVQEYGGGFLPGLCVVMAIGAIIAAIAFLFPRFLSFAARLLVELLEFLGPR